MYILQCAGGHAVPLKGGKFEVIGVHAKVNDPTAASRLTLIDDLDIPQAKDDANLGRVLADDNQKVVLCDCHGLANADAEIGIIFAEPIKIRKALSVINATNLKGGRVCVHVR